MTLNRTLPAGPRVRPIREHAYTLPVVRELPARPPDAVGAQWLW
jgi:hypothetical protein